MTAPGGQDGRTAAEGQGDRTAPGDQGDRTAPGDQGGRTAGEGPGGLEAQFAQWRQYVQRRPELQQSDAEELEDHLRGSVDELVAVGLRPDEAFLVAVKRLGGLDDLSREFAREHSERLWKQLVLTGGADDTETDTRSRRDLTAMIICAAGAALSIKVPELFGLSLDRDGAFYAPNFSLFALPWLAAYLARRRRAGTALIGVMVALFALGAVAANVYPLAEDSQSLVLTSIHLPIALWFVVGLAYVADDPRSSRRRMDFIRFTGECFVYFVLIALGGGVLVAFTVGTFEAIGIDPEGFISQWLLPCGVVAAVVVAGWLVEAKQSVVENIAPVLTRLFTPLFTAALLAFLVALVWTTSGINVEREALILFNLLLVVVLGLLLYSISARDPLAPPGLFDRLQLALVVSALIIDVLVLREITARITEYGTTPNKLAALGENVILLANLAWSAWLMLGFVRRRAPFAALERWQTGYLPVYAGWAWAVVLLFPPMFHHL
ncbi:permease prefix domain 1-containing protein [Micromonospora sp. WMMD1082]|uniref:permease prefix domain 1-containing protein n=1 Tax=Micromonospora sp. WMMD1082 TaxID=3016104 RepID=UPI002416839D|nr:permease prefix domain 1-containing protein [Micromonospora sp. WMMD1082]MDG4798838.1 permease prefix domain 1-containing protein [Micromonospora sp. WMMD1082]